MDCSAAIAASAKATIVTCVIQPPDWRVYITPALVAISAIIAFLAMLNTGRVARKRATIDLIEKVESTQHYRDNATRFSQIRRRDGFAPLSNPQTDDEKADRRAVVDYLNHYELVSLGILKGALDDGIYRNWMRGPFTRDWNAAASWIQRERWKRAENGEWEYYPKVFAAYGMIARRWSREAIALSRAWGGPPSDADAGGPGDERLPASPDEEGGESTPVSPLP